MAAITPPDRPADRVLLAARNNALWCDAVCRTHGLRGSMAADAWSVPTRTPPYYPDAVTLSPDVDEYDLLARLDSTDGCSVKDSWSRLDLTVEDFARLVVGEWVWLGPGQARSGDGRWWEPVGSADDFAHWVRAWASDEDALAVLRPDLLMEPGVHVLAARSHPGGDIVAGCIVNITGEVAGVSNLFDSDGGDPERTWRGAATAAHEVVDGIPLVGWEAGDSLAAAVAAGCERIGPLTVWIR
ncbi:hypothetical protein ACWEOW_04670 [Monashia sp. NPDC004114]